MTGRSIARSRPARRADAGVTLAEMLVVLVVIGVAAAAATLGLRPGATGTARDEAARLAGLMTLAADEALAGDQVLSLTWADGSYQFRRWSDAAQGWQAPASEPLGAARTLPPGLTLHRTDGGGAEVRMRPDGLSPAAVVELADRSGDLQRVAFDGLTARVEERP